MRRFYRVRHPAVGLILSISVVMTCVALSPGQAQGPTPSSPGMGIPNTPTGYDDRRCRASQQTGGWSVSGKVVIEDGTPPPGPVSVELVCPGGTALKGSTNSKGGFYLRRDSTVDASLGSPCSVPSQGAGGQSGGPSGAPMGECEVRVQLTGYRTETRRGLFSSTRGTAINANLKLDLKTFILHPLPDVGATPVSLASLAAPKKAKAAFEKGKGEMERGKLDEAARQLESAVELYPKYSEAWYELGRVREQQHNTEGAVQAYRRSIEVEPKFIKPYNELTAVLVQTENWTELATISAQALKLDPVEFPWLWVSNAMANFRLGKAAEAEEAAARAIKIDEKRQFSIAHYLLGVLLFNRGDYQGAAGHMRTYLELAPNGENAPAAKQQLARIESVSASPAGAANAAPK